jgi:hypothetical protein
MKNIFFVYQKGDGRGGFELSLARIEAGKLIADKRGIAADVAKMADGDVSVEIKPYRRPKTYEQLKAFHGVIVPQVQAFIESRERACATRSKRSRTT